MRTRQSGAVFFILLALIALAFLGFCLYALSQAMNTRFEDAQLMGVPPATTGDAPFVQAWSVPLNPPLVHEMALSPGRPGEFLALNKDEIHRFDQAGERLGSFAAPSKSTRIATDPTGAMPYIMVVSSSTKWTGAIDYVVTTDYFLQALDTTGHEIWKERFDPKAISTPEPFIATLNSRPVVVLSASKRILCFDSGGTQLWDVPLWHHPGTVTSADLDGDGSGALLAALAPRKEIVRIGADGNVLGPWGKGDGPRRFRAIKTDNAIFGVPCARYSEAAQASGKLSRSSTAEGPSFVRSNCRRTWGCCRTHLSPPWMPTEAHDGTG